MTLEFFFSKLGHPPILVGLSTRPDNSTRDRVESLGTPRTIQAEGLGPGPAEGPCLEGPPALGSVGSLAGGCASTSAAQKILEVKCMLHDNSICDHNKMLITRAVLRLVWPFGGIVQYNIYL